MKPWKQVRRGMEEFFRGLSKIHLPPYIPPTTHTYPCNSEEAFKEDREALRRDYEKVGQDIWRAIRAYNESLTDEQWARIRSKGWQRDENLSDRAEERIYQVYLDLAKNYDRDWSKYDKEVPKDIFED